MIQLEPRLASLSPAATWAISLALVLVIGLIDLVTGTEVSVSIFYLLPVGLITWRMGLGAGTVLSAAAVMTWLGSDAIDGRHYAHLAIPFWNGAMRLCTFLIVSSLVARLRDAHRHEQELARVDGLTGIANLRRFQELALAELERSRRFGHPFVVAYVDIDDFKLVNDRQGHAEGDEALRAVAATLRRSLRTVDLVARLGGDEFAVLLAETPREAASIVLMRLHHEMVATAREREWPIGFSVGAVTVDDPPARIEPVIRAADDVLYAIKREGKGRIRCQAFDPGSPPSGATSAGAQDAPDAGAATAHHSAARP